MKQFFDSVPVSIDGAARMDGAPIFRTCRSVVLPMARPALIALTIVSLRGSRNDLGQFIVVTEGTTDQLAFVAGLASLIGGQQGAGPHFPLKLCAAMVATITVALLSFSPQRYFIRGANAGMSKVRQGQAVIYRQISQARTCRSHSQLGTGQRASAEVVRDCLAALRVGSGKTGQPIAPQDSQSAVGPAVTVARPIAHSIRKVES